MKLTKEALNKIIKEEMEAIMAEEETGSFYKSPAGALFGNSHFGDENLKGMNGLEQALEDASGPIYRIKSVAEACRTRAAGGEDSHAMDQDNYDYFDKMVKICDNLLEIMQTNVLMQF